MRSGSAYGSGLSSTAFTKVKIAVLPPMSEGQGGDGDDREAGALEQRPQP